MKIIILHGENTLKSYDRLQKLLEIAKARNWEIVRIANSLIDIPEALISNSLFEKNRLVVVENANLFNKSIISWLKKKKDMISTTLIIYHPGDISKTFLKSLPKIDKTEEYKLPKLIWSFLDSISPGNSRIALQLFHKVIENESVEFVFMLLAKQLRDLYWVKTDVKSIPYPEWRIGKLKRQSMKFDKNDLRDLIDDIAIADIKSKTSQANLIDSLDFILITKLE